MWRFGFYGIGLWLKFVSSVIFFLPLRCSNGNSWNSSFKRHSKFERSKEISAFLLLMFFVSSLGCEIKRSARVSGNYVQFINVIFRKLGFLTYIGQAKLVSWLICRDSDYILSAGECMDWFFCVSLAHIWGSLSKIFMLSRYIYNCSLFFAIKKLCRFFGATISFVQSRSYML